MTTPIYPTRLINFGNGCFFNSMTQFLATSDEFRQKVSELKSNNTLAAELSRVFSNMTLRNPNAMNLKSLYDVTPKVPGTGPGQQGDAAEFAMYTLAALPGTEICFGVRMQSKIECTSCHAETVVPVETCVKEFALDFDEKVTPDNFIRQIKKQDVALPGYKCEKCGVTNKCVKHSALRRARKCVVINVARSEEIVPIESFQLLMNVNGETKYVTYKFVAAVKHVGTPHAGHYICIAARSDGNASKLFRLDDDSISPATISDATGAVLLMYQAV